MCQRADEGLIGISCTSWLRLVTFRYPSQAQRIVINVNGTPRLRLVQRIPRLHLTIRLRLVVRLVRLLNHVQC